MEEKVVQIADNALKERGYQNAEIGVQFVGRKKAKNLNIQYRGQDYIPQVLGFPLSKEVDRDGMIRLGDIVICTQKLKYEAKIFQKRETEAVLEEWLKHGVDNLLK